MAGTEVDGGTATASPAGPPEDQPVSRVEARRARRRRSRRRWWVVVLGLLAALVLAAGAYAAVRETAPLPTATVVVHHPGPVTVPGSATLPWPAAGQGAVAVPELGYASQSGPESPVPVASLTKMATALVVLRDHPLGPGEPGPTIAVTADDAHQYAVDRSTGQSTVVLQVGEQLTERQALEALLLASANDVAYLLAVWDAGSTTAFVGEMNAAAARLGATATHYADVSGYDPGSVSTAADSLRVAAAGLAEPAFAEIVAMPSATLPVVGTVTNLVGQVGSFGVVGVKSGFTSQAGACLVLAGTRPVGGTTVEVLVAVVGQPYVVPPPSTTTTTTTTATPAGSAPPPTSSTTTTVPPPVADGTSPFLFAQADRAADPLLEAARAAVEPVTVATAGTPVAAAEATWRGGRGAVAAVTASGASLVGWPGQQVTRRVVVDRPPAGAGAGRPVGALVARLGRQTRSVPLRLARPLAPPSFWDRLLPA